MSALKNQTFFVDSFSFPSLANQTQSKLRLSKMLSIQKIICNCNPLCENSTNYIILSITSRFDLQVRGRRAWKRLNINLNWFFSSSENKKSTKPRFIESKCRAFLKFLQIGSRIAGFTMDYIILSITFRFLFVVLKRKDLKQTAQI